MSCYASSKLKRLLLLLLLLLLPLLLLLLLLLPYDIDLVCGYPFWEKSDLANVYGSPFGRNLMFMGALGLFGPTEKPDELDGV